MLNWSKDVVIVHFLWICWFDVMVFFAMYMTTFSCRIVQVLL